MALVTNAIFHSARIVMVLIEPQRGGYEHCHTDINQTSSQFLLSNNASVRTSNTANTIAKKRLVYGDFERLIHRAEHSSIQNRVSLLKIPRAIRFINPDESLAFSPHLFKPVIIEKQINRTITIQVSASKAVRVGAPCT
jgi:hypothetical protein